MGGSKKVNGHRRRTCVCRDARCSYISKLYCLVNDTQLCAFIRIPKYSSRNTERGRVVRHFRGRIYAKVDVEDPKDESIKEEWISAIHFERPLLKEDNGGVIDTMDAKSFKKFLPQTIFSRFTRRTDQVQEGLRKGHFYILPTMSFNEIQDRLNNDRKEGGGDWDTNMVDIEQTGRVDPTQRQVDFISRRMEKNPRQMAIEYLRMESEIVELKLIIKSMKKEHELEVASLQATIQSLHADFKQYIRLEQSGVNRITISSREWHKENPDACRFLFGVMDDFDELVILLTKGFFPEVKPVGGTDDAITDFEKMLVCLMRMRRRFEFQTLAMIVGRDDSQISRYIDEWMPKLGRVGRFCCRLDMDKLHDYLSAEQAEDLGVPHSSKQPAPKHRYYFGDALPLEFSVEEGMNFIAALKDGKDFMTDTSRLNSALTRQMWSDKVHNSAARCITWVTPSGFVFEYTGLFLARSPEIRLVEFYGQQR